MRSPGIQRWRKAAVAVQAALVVGLPFVRLGGESALRFDVPTFRLFFFGATLAAGEYFILLVGSLLFLLGVITVTLVFGRVWCGWLCPQTALMEIVDIVKGALSVGGKAPSASGYARRAVYHLFLAALALLVSVNLTWYFVSPYEMLPGLMRGEVGRLTVWCVGVFWAALMLQFELLGRRFCATICPYAKMQDVLMDSHSLTIGFDTSRRDDCMGCDLCVRACPTGIDIKAGPQVQCVGCARCIDACVKVKSRKGGTSLVGYMFGTPTGRFRDALTFKSIALTAVIAGVGVLTAAVYSGSPDVEVSAVRLSGAACRVAPDGGRVAPYRLELANRGGADVSLSLSVSGMDGAILAAPENPVTVAGNGRRTMAVFVKAPAGVTGKTPVRIVISATDPKSGAAAEARTSFFCP
ncbi:MAG: 4Fe-4S binding protein [Nitrospirae bacterium]|nr:4Fe-4S binding protein [Nitrospirota bacterium]